MSKTVVNKVTKVVWDNGFKPDGVNIPSVTSADQGKVLAVDSNGKWVAASPAAPQSELPVYTAADEGKILKVDDQGALEWAEDDNTEYTAGDNISIVNGEISAVDTTYTAGDNIEISAQNVISATDTTYTAGTNVQINNGVISATDTTYSAGSGISITGTVIAADDQLPAVTSVDEGKVLKVDNNGTWTVGSDNNTTYSAGTNITIDANNQISAVDTTYSAGTGITITGTTIAADSQLPAYSATENGKVLSVDGNGDLEWATPSGGGETLTLIDSTTVTSITTATWSSSMVLAVISSVDFGNYTKFLIEITPDKTGPTNTNYLLGVNAETGFYLEGRKIGSDYVFNPLYMGKYSNKASNPNYNVMCCLSAQKMDFADHSDLYVYARSDSLNGSVQPYLFMYSNTKVALYGVS